jgi:dTDP-glucose 4,6-dehydratase
MRLLVTGGAGFVGSHYVRRVLADAWGLRPPTSVVVLDKLTYAGNLANLATVLDDPRLTFVEGDILDRMLVDQLVGECDAIVHCAAESHVDRSILGAADFVMTNVVGTHVLLDAALTHRVSRFVHVSTDEVYGSIAVGRSSETDPLRPSSPYPASKASSDLLAGAYHRTHDLPVTVTRSSNNYGPYQFPEKIIPLFVTRLLSGESVPVLGDGEHVRDWLHVDDHCRALHLVLLEGRAGETYNIGGGSPMTNNELTTLLLDACGAPGDRVRHVPDRPGHDRRYCVDARKLEHELGFTPGVPFIEGLTATVAWYRDHPEWWQPLRRRAELAR